MNLLQIQLLSGSPLPGAEHCSGPKVFRLWEFHFSMIFSIGHGDGSMHGNVNGGCKNCRISALNSFFGGGVLRGTCHDELASCLSNGGRGCVLSRW